jgi:hypothetical protein
MAKPVFEPRLAELRIVAGSERPPAQFAPK